MIDTQSLHGRIGNSDNRLHHFCYMYVKDFFSLLKNLHEQSVSLSSPVQPFKPLGSLEMLTCFVEQCGSVFSSCPKM